RRTTVTAPFGSRRGCRGGRRLFGAGPLLSQGVPGKGPKPREAVTGVNVVFDDIEGEVVGAGEAPHRHRQQQGHVEARALQEDERGREQAAEKEEPALKVKEPPVRDVAHPRTPGRPRPMIPKGRPSQSGTQLPWVPQGTRRGNCTTA